MRKIIIVFLCLTCSFLAFSQARKTAPKRAAAKTMQAATTEKTVYRYARKQEFDFEAIDVQADYGAGLGDIMVSSRAQDKFKNKLPYRKNFNREIRKSLERIR